MPTYEYACKQCGEHLEAVQKFTDAPLTECPSCGGELRKVFGNVGIVFKGSGFYKTDSRESASVAPAASAPTATSDSPSTPTPASTTPAPSAPAPASTPASPTPSSTSTSS
jgi:putative FmdB family regulatory protein